MMPLFPPPGGIGGPLLPQFSPNLAAIGDTVYGGNTGAFANILAGNFYMNVVLDIAQEEGLARILAEPNLTALSGQNANFISGGSFPVPVPSNNDNQRNTIEYKPYGVQLDFVPTVLDSGLINLDISVKVSEIDPRTSSENFGFGLIERGANSNVEIPSGQTLAIAGLLNERLSNEVSKFPGLGDVPILGTLFRSQAYQKRQTELMIFVTPRLARPFDTDLMKLPTDDFVEPSDTEFYLMGRLEGRGSGQPSLRERLGPNKDGSEGAFGHDL
jgi:pilus assembly protein CpaC